ncbi:MAG: hypothetical protein QNJ42_22610 [Crocosphaera sp.]|nr:hypothetical protein [Crocosphaera sp.]
MVNKILSLFVLIPSVFYGINHGSTNAQIPQGSFQQNYIEGYSNEVTQELNQTFNVNFIDIPKINGSIIPNVNIQGRFLDNLNNIVNQEINQNVFDFSLIPLDLNNFGLSNFIGSDKVLNGLQFSEQQAFIQGDNNVTHQLSKQSLTNFFFLEQSDKITELNDFSQFITRLLEVQLLDFFQFSSQDSVVFGNSNMVNQNITQIIDIFIFSDSDFNRLLKVDDLEEDNFVKPTQLTIQETFINASDNNIITQSINQSIQQISLIESDIFSQKNYLLSGLNNTNIESDNLVEFPIDTFINEILNNTIIEGQQINRQFLEVIGNSNQNIQENKQVLDLVRNQELPEFEVNPQNFPVSVPEPSNLKTMIVLLGIISLSRFCHSPILRSFLLRD